MKRRFTQRKSSEQFAQSGEQQGGEMYIEVMVLMRIQTATVIVDRVQGWSLSTVTKARSS